MTNYDGITLIEIQEIYHKTFGNLPARFKNDREWLIDRLNNPPAVPEPAEEATDAPAETAQEPVGLENPAGPKPSVEAEPVFGQPTPNAAAVAALQEGETPPAVEVPMDKLPTSQITEEMAQENMEKPMGTDEKAAEMKITIATLWSEGVRLSYEKIQHFYGFSNDEAYKGELEKYKLQPQEQIIVDSLFKISKKSENAVSINIGLMPDWVKPIVEKYGLTSEIMNDAIRLEKEVRSQALACAKRNTESWTEAQTAAAYATADEEIGKIKSYVTFCRDQHLKRNKSV